ncbi:MAG: phosphate signaling complex protein PhoU [Lactobacillaceae bacterium]|jgi:phosphate transport system protein|nr:phosphate signaling complex protein PhoU [Lactobacillaceae bacterium]
MRRLFDEELSDLDNQFIEMGKMVSRTIDRSVASFTAHDVEVADDIINRDHEINEREQAIEKKAFEIIALYQPVTTDLREVVTILKAVSGLERMGDYARNIAQSTIRVKDREKGEKRIPEIERQLNSMGSATSHVVDEVLDAYVADDARRSAEIIEQESQVAVIGDDIRSEVLNSMKNNPDTIDAGSDYLVVNGYLRRIADHATDIAEWIIYKRTGKIVELNPGSSTFI